MLFDVSERKSKVARSIICCLKAISNAAAPGQSDAFIQIVAARLSGSASTRKMTAAIVKNKDVQAESRSLQKVVETLETQKIKVKEAVTGEDVKVTAE